MLTRNPHTQLLNSARRAGLAFFLLWLVVSAYGIWKYASLETEPPVFDALSYVQKAQAFWSAVGSGHLFNPLNLDPPIRPFATVFFTHPYGFTDDFRPFYFLSAFLPSLILSLAVVVACGRRAWQTARGVFLTVILLTVSASLPSYYQFASNEGVPVMGTWGFVDTLFGALGAVAIAFATRSVSANWMRSTIASALIAVLTIFVKPAGLTLLVLTAGAWGLVSLGSVWRGTLTWPRFAKGLCVYLVIYGLTAWILYGSQYFSKENYLYGLSSMRLLHEAQAAFPTIDEIVGKLNLAFGAPFTLLTLFGLCCAVRSRHWERFAVAAICLSGGMWLWLGQTNIEHIRYFFPFPVMALIATIPSLMSVGVRIPRTLVVIMVVLLVPTAVIGALLLAKHPSPAIERAVGINLATNLHPAEVAQARKLVEVLASDPSRNSIIYYCGVAPKVKAFEAVMDWSRVLGLRGGNSSPALPIDWVREHAYRLDDIIAARFVVFEPYSESASVALIFPDVDSFDKEQIVVRAWLSTLTGSDGVRIVSDGAVRVLEIIDPLAFTQAAVDRLLPNHVWRTIFLQSFTERSVVKPAAVKALQANILPEPVTYRANQHEVAIIDAVVTNEQPDGSRVFDVYVAQKASPPEPGTGWTLFVHATDGGGEIAQAYSPYKDRIVSDTGDLHYRLVLPATVRPPSQYALGFFRHLPNQEDKYLLSDHGDWDGRRHVILLSTPAAGINSKH